MFVRPYPLSADFCHQPLSELAIMAIHPSRTLAAANPITVTSQTDAVSFPKSIDFQVSATDFSSTITNATVFIKDSNTPYSTPHIVSITTPAHTITFTAMKISLGLTLLLPVPR